MSVWIVNEVLSFVTQTSLILIFLEIGKMNPLKVSMQPNAARITGKTASERYQTFKLEYKEEPDLVFKINQAYDHNESALISD